MIALNYDEKINYREAHQFCESYKICFIPIEDFNYFSEDNYILENLFGLFLVRKIKKSSSGRKKKKDKIKVDKVIEEKDECSFNSNYKIESHIDLEEKEKLDKDNN